MTLKVKHGQSATFTPKSVTKVLLPQTICFFVQNASKTGILRILTLFHVCTWLRGFPFPWQRLDLLTLCDMDEFLSLCASHRYVIWGHAAHGHRVTAAWNTLCKISAAHQNIRMLERALLWPWDDLCDLTTRAPFSKCYLAFDQTPITIPWKNDVASIQTGW